MFRYIAKKINFQKLKNENDRQNEARDKEKRTPIPADLNKNRETLQNIFCNSHDVIYCEFNFGRRMSKRASLIYIDGMVDRDALEKNVLEPLQDGTAISKPDGAIDYTSMRMLKNSILHVSDTLIVDTLEELLDHLMSGSAILFIDGFQEALVINAKKWEHRNISEPETESVVRGPREGFTENLKTNLTLLRRKIKDTDFCIESLKIGDKTNTDISIAYIKNTAPSQLLEEVKARLKKIRTDSIIDSGYIEQFIEDAPYSIYSTIANSEKPDNTAAKILEGRVAILVDGSPFALTVPMLFIESFQVSEDYYSRTVFASFIRFLRFVSYIISVLSPAIYVALTVFHQELIPTQLLISIASGREPVPFPAVIEAAIMIVTFDILREAGVRLPKPVGSAISIVGALVLGQSAVSAGLISPIMVIVVAATAIASFVVPSQTDSGTIMRYIYLILAGLAGGFGIIMGLLINLIYITSITSFGMPYFSPIAPLVPSDLKDTVIRMPLWTVLKQPKSLTAKASAANGSRPSRSKKGTEEPSQKRG